jgi:formylglycine-generating enzyme required for sulfatase activity
MRNWIIAVVFFLLVCATPAAQATPSTITAEDGEEMVLVPAGEFIMGLPKGEPGSHRNPLRKVYLKAFYVDKYEVTNEQYHKCVAQGGCTDPSLIIDYPHTFFEAGKKWYTMKSMKDYPVVGITWLQAENYCEWAGKRLPLGTEWEKAARGTDGRTYPWGNEWDGTRANWDEGGKVDGYKKLAPAGGFPKGASPYGAMDMAGNVREWVDDAVVRGGSWYSNPISLRCGDPGHDYIVERDDDMGFRCAMDAEPAR